MKNIAQVLNVFMSLALLILVVKMPRVTNEVEIATSEVATDAYEVIKTRSSVRSYQNRAVSVAAVDSLLHAAMAAPTAGNKQPWAFVVIRDTVTLKLLGEKLPYARMVAHAPVAIVACGDLSKGFSGIESEYWVQDVAAATQNILLAAHAAGLGAVWTGVYPVESRVKDVAELLGLPCHIVPLNVIPVGYPDSQPVPKEKFKEENIHHERW